MFLTNLIRVTYILFKAPPMSQSHGLQPSISLLRPQCWGWKGKLLYTSTKTQTQNTHTHNALLPHTGRNFVQSQDVCSNSFLSEYHKDFLFGVCLEDYSCTLRPQTHTKERQIWSYTLTTENRKSFRGQSLERTWNKLFVCVYVCVFTHADSLMGHRWGHSVPFYSGHNVVPPH